MQAVTMFLFPRPRELCPMGSVHVRDMISLQHMHPEVAEDFCKGGFTIRKSQHPFLAIAIDQAHEQNNAFLKEDSGAVGLTQNPGAFKRCASDSSM